MEMRNHFMKERYMMYMILSWYIVKIQGTNKWKYIDIFKLPYVVNLSKPIKFTH